MAIALFTTPVKGRHWDGEDANGHPVTIIGLERAHGDTEPHALVVDADAIPHRVPWSQVDFTSVASTEDAQA